MAEATTLEAKPAGFFKNISSYGDMAFAMGIVCILMVLLFPVPIIILDMLLAISITISVIILMTTLFISKPLEMSVFPSILLVTTMLRLSLNIASTRLILSHGHKGPSAAGHVIEAFGGFVMQGNVVIGIIVFLILTLINFIVITKGSGRIAEVAARFSLDSMPGKQMAIDADLSAGLIDENTAKTRRKDLEDESTFYGAMDGANKFVRGDAIAGLLITAINLIAGIIIGVVQRGISFDSAIKTYTMLTIGDGLVSQIPSLIVSLSAGLLVSKSGVTGSAEKAIFGQLSKYPKSLWMSCIVTGMMALIPGLPFMPFFVLSTASGFIAYNLKKTIEAQLKSDAANDTTQRKTSSLDGSVASAAEGTRAEGDVDSKDQPISQSLSMDSVRLELGYDLLPLINYQKGHKLTEQIKALRRQIAQDFGFIMPPVRIQDNLQLDSNAYQIKIKEIECGQGTVIINKIMVMDPKGEEIKLEGVDSIEPAFGLKARWISENLREEALFNNYTVVDPPTVITTHLTEIIKENITELITYSETQKLLDEVGEEHQKLIKDVIPSPVTISTLQKVLQSLLSEMISIRDLPTIIEATADMVSSTSNLSKIVEAVRGKLSRQICHANTNNSGYIVIVTLSPEWEQDFKEALISDGNDKHLAMPPSKLQEFITRVSKVYDELATKGHFPVLLTSGTIRPYVRSVIERFKSSIMVMSQNEIHPKSKIKTVGMI